MMAGSASRPISSSWPRETSEICFAPVAGLVAQPPAAIPKAKTVMTSRAHNAARASFRIIVDLPYPHTLKWNSGDDTPLRRFPADGTGPGPGGRNGDNRRRAGSALRGDDQVPIRGRRGEGELGTPRRSHGGRRHGVRPLV